MAHVFHFPRLGWKAQFKGTPVSGEDFPNKTYPVLLVGFTHPKKYMSHLNQSSQVWLKPINTLKTPAGWV